MRITAIEDLHADGGWRVYSYLKITTDEGLVGWSEYHDGFNTGGATALIRRFAAVVIGMDPRRAGAISAALHATVRLAPGGVNHMAIAAIENACLDIQAKAAGAPVHALFGGPFRDEVELYWTHCVSFRALHGALFERTLGVAPVRTLDDVAAVGREVTARGFRAAKTNPLVFGPEGPRMVNAGWRMGPGFLDRNPDGSLIAAIGDQLAAFREGLGPQAGLMLDLNFGQRPEGFRRIAHAIEAFDPAWLEIDTTDAAALAGVRNATRVPIASLESMYGLGAYRPFLEAGAVDVAIVDPIWNGVWQSVRIATLADAFETAVAPHNFMGALGSMISAHFCAAIPNVRIMEYEVDEVPWAKDFTTHSPVIDKGRMAVPVRPGWGADVVEEALLAHPPPQRPLP
jgi:L-alanine-DL-glutamate epimerase-like enolase superfamily enzyme